MGKCVSIQKDKLRQASLPSHHSEEVPEDSICEIKTAVVLHRVPNENSKRLISESLKKHYLFSGLSNEDMEIMLTKLKFYSIPQGEVIFEQGSVGKKFYIIESGTLGVYLNNVKKTVLKEGENFGDMALLTDAARRATIKTIEDSTLWGIGREQFKAAIKVINAKMFQINKEFISNLQIFTRLPEEQIAALTEATVQHEYRDNKRIICEGDEGTMLFIIKEGNAVAKIKGVERFRIGQGEMFGEAVVLGDNKIRNISVYPIGIVKLLSISKESITSIIGENFKDIIYKAQAKNSLSSDPISRMLSKEIIYNLLEVITWVSVKPGELAITKEMLDEKIFILCLGSLSSPNRSFSKNEVIGFSHKDLAPDSELFADTEVVLGEFKIVDLEKLTKSPWHQLKSELKVMIFLSKLEIFAGFTYSKLRYIAAHAKIKEFDKKDVIYRCNDEAYEFYAIKRGKVEILHNRKVLRILSKCDVFGDRCILETIRINTAKAVNNVQVICINSVDFRDIMEEGTIKLLQRKKSYLSLFSLNQIIMVKIKQLAPEKYETLSYIEHTNTYITVIVYRKDYFDTVEKFNAVVKEKSIALQMEHIFINKSIQTFSDANFIYLASQYVETYPLSGIAAKKMNEDCVKFLAACFVLILEYLHNKDIIYRALSLQSINITSSGYPLISDFSCAKIVKGRTYSVVGDPIYAAPEIGLKKGYLKAVDLWSLGILLYQLLYNTYPFNVKQTDSPMEIYQKVTTDSITFPADTKFIRGNEVIADLLKINSRDRLSLRQVKYSRWLDSIDWERLATAELVSPLTLDFSPSKANTKGGKMISLPRYLNVKYIQESLSADSPKRILKFKWDQHF